MNIQREILRPPRRTQDDKRTLGGAVVGVLLLVLAGCGGKEAAKPTAAERVSGVRVEAVKMEAVPDEIEAPGTVASAATAQVAARVMGTVTAVHVREGDAVRAGQTLVEIDERELAERRRAAKAAVDEAVAAREEALRGVAAAQAQADVMAKTYERFAMLREKKSVSPQEFDEVEAKQRGAQEGLAAAKARQQQVTSMRARAQAELRAVELVVGYTRVTAPFSGVVVRRMAEAGSMAAPGMPLVVVEDASRYRIEVTVDASAAAQVKRGSKARVELDALPGKIFAGTVAELEAGADAASHTVRARIDLPRDRAIRSGLFGRAWFARGERKAIALPAGAILHRGQLHGVYVLDAEGIARLRMVTLGRTIGEPFGAAQDRREEILSGISEGERVVMEPAGRELDGKKVEK
ncbi:MAG: efflux RND transporter periplasmic adaptor subunit [Acidobacteria bacterium]|nr:efflux RND transporter periplasmic adaptor subunit [Acidobacteriota bacterium]